MIIVVTGPTASGKTKLSEELSSKYKLPIINADSMQVYKGLDIGTAKVTEEEKCGVPHFLFDIVDVEDMYTVYDYQKDLRKLLDEYKDRNVIIVGGTGLYLKSALYNYEFDEETELDTFDDKTNEELFKEVKEKYPELDIHVNNRKRLVRALNRDEVKTHKDELLYPAVFIGLTTDRDTLYERINLRVDKMVKEGLLEEVKHFYDLGLRSKAIMTGIGYKELYDYFDGKITLDESLDLIKQRSRKYAKRQYTWFKNQMIVNWIDVDFKDFNNTFNEAIGIIENN